MVRHVVDLELSDLFFNHGHDRIEEVYRDYRGENCGPSPSDLASAYLEAADEFCKLYPSIVGRTTANELADDYASRV